jgi:hypothetical protein
MVQRLVCSACAGQHSVNSSHFKTLPPTINIWKILLKTLASIARSGHAMVHVEPRSVY